MNLRGLGSGAGRLMVLIDGHPQYMGIMGHPIADGYQSYWVERVEVLRGPASVLYGANAMGGVINIVTRKMREEGIKTNINVGGGAYGTLQTEAVNRMHKGRFTSIVSGSYNRTDGHRANMGFEQYGGYAKLGYQLTETWKVGADVNVTHFNASQPGTLSVPLTDADQHITRGMTFVRIENAYEKTSGTLSFFYNWGRHKINDGYNATAGDSPKDYRFNSSDNMMGISWYQNMYFFKGNKLTVGADWYHFGGKAWNKFVSGKRQGEESELVNRHQDEIAGYVDLLQDVGSFLTLNAGVRIDHHDHIGTEWIPQAGLAFHLPGTSDLKLTVGRGFRYPFIKDMFMWGTANPDLKAESLWNYELGFTQRLFDDRLSYGLNLFYANGSNMIVTSSVDGRMVNTNTGKIKNTGIEVQANYAISQRWSSEANYSYLHMKYPVISAPQHKLYAGVVFSQGRWDLGSGIQYINGLYTSVQANDIGNESTENFMLWNIRGSYRLTKGLQLWVRGENLLAQKYEIMKGYPMPKATFMGGLNINF